MRASYTTRNKLLQILSPEDLESVLSHAEFVELSKGDCVEPAHAKVDYAYFLNTGVISVVAKMPNDRSIEAGMIGYEGMCGIPLLTGARQSPNEAMVQVPGQGLRVPAAVMEQLMAERPAMRILLLRYLHVFMTQVATTALANGQLKLEQRLARCILMAHDRASDNGRVMLTHEYMAQMLGVRRPGVTVSLHVLEGRKLIRSTRGEIAVLDRAGLEDATDGAYGISEGEYERVIGIKPYGKPVTEQQEA